MSLYKKNLNTFCAGFEAKLHQNPFSNFDKEIKIIVDKISLLGSKAIEVSKKTCRPFVTLRSSTLF